MLFREKSAAAIQDTDSSVNDVRASNPLDTCNMPTNEASMTHPNNSTFKVHSGSYSAHSTPRRRRGVSVLSDNEKSNKDTNDDIYMKNGKPLKNLESSTEANSSPFFKDIFGSKFSHYLSTISISNTFLSFSNESLLNTSGIKGNDKDNCHNSKSLSDAKNNYEGRKHSCITENESLSTKHDIHSDIVANDGPEENCTAKYKNSLEKHNTYAKSDSTISLDTQSQESNSNAIEHSEHKGKRYGNREETVSRKPSRSLTSNSIKRDDPSRDKTLPLKRNQSFHFGKSSSSKSKKPGIQICEENHSDKKVNHEQNSNEAFNKKLCTTKENVTKQHPKKLLQNKSVETKNSFKKEYSQTDVLSHLKEKENGKRIETKLQTPLPSTDPENQTKFSRTSITNKEKCQNSIKRRRIRNKCTLHTFGKAKNHVLSLSSKVPQIIFDNEPSERQRTAVKPNYASFDILPTNSFPRKTTNEKVEVEPINPTSSLGNLRMRLLASELNSSDKQDTKLSCSHSSNSLQKPSPSNTFARSFFMRKDNNSNEGRFYNNHNLQSHVTDSIHELELSETTCSLPNTPFKKRSKLVENNNTSKVEEKVNNQFDKSQSRMKMNKTLDCRLETSLSTINNNYNHMPFNRSHTSLSYQPVSKAGGRDNASHLWAASKSKSHSFQMLSSSSKSTKQPCIAPQLEVKERLLGKRLLETNKHNQRKQKSLCCYVDKQWKVRVWLELTNFSIDFNGFLSVSSNNNTSNIPNVQSLLVQDCDNNGKNANSLLTNESPREDTHPLGFLGFRSLNNTPRGSGDLSIASSSISSISQQQPQNHENVLVQFEHNCKPTISYSKDWNFKGRRKMRSESCCMPNSNRRERLLSCHDNNSNFSESSLVSINKTNKDFNREISAKRLNDILWYRFLSRLGILIYKYHRHFFHHLNQIISSTYHFQ